MIRTLSAPPRVAIVPKSRVPQGYAAARILIAEIAEQWGFTAEQIVSNKRLRTYNKCRKQIARELVAMDFSTPEVGELMNRDHATILAWIKDR